MKEAGQEAIREAQANGRWAAAYDPPAKAEVPADLQAEFKMHREAKAFFDTLDARNRYAVLFRIQTAKKPETRSRWIEKFVAMLEKHEKLHP